ncbi:hypothetical protein I552_3780 [Mycobacterium xenopi 3993]|nr:hypothetical protein I552_3780 [Mycobacterium xenopi 3993]
MGRRAGTFGLAGERCSAEPSTVTVGDDEIIGGSGDGDHTAVVQAMMVGADQHQVGYKSLIYLLLACILPVWRW